MVATWFQFWLFLHILAVIVAFGPTFTFGPIAALARKDPSHAVAYAKTIHWIEQHIVIPVAALVPLLGTALIYTGHIDLRHSEWLGISIILFIIAFFFALFVQLPNSGKMADALASMPPGPPPEGAGPPPEIARLGQKLQFGGIFLSVMLLTILVLMIWKPGNTITGF